LSIFLKFLNILIGEKTQKIISHTKLNILFFRILSTLKLYLLTSLDTKIKFKAYSLKNK
jgi:hypothetical protein